MAVGSKSVPAAQELGVKDRARRRPRSRGSTALALSLAAAMLALVGALGPATKERGTYSWPPRELPRAQPTTQWYAPLLLTRVEPAELDATLPCRARSLPRASRPLTMLATTRSAAAGGLRITRSADRATFSMGDEIFASVSLRAGDASGTCSVRVHVEGDRWSIATPSGATRRGDLEGQRPVVSGLFSGIDLRRGADPSISVTTQPFGTRPTIAQKVAWILATIFAVSALVLVAYRLPRRPGRRDLADATLAAARSLRPVDGFVAALLITWWIVGPVLFDDGWVKARQTNYAASNGFSNYYTTFGANLPLDFWLEWLQHWVIGSFDALVVLRLPTLALLAGAWIACRWVLGRLVAGTGQRSAGAEWALGIAFTLNAFAWGVTLRPEPAVALLLTGVFACAVRFIERPAAAPLAIASVLVALALSAHPAGLVSLAPLIVISPRILEWARTKTWVLPATIGLSALALLIVLGTVGSDLSQRTEEARLSRTVGDAIAGWREELSRYEFRGAEATTLRRESVALMLVALFAYLLRGDRRSRLPLDLPAASLGVALLLLIPTPSKWAWHFGALAGLAALAVAAEVVRLRASSVSRSPVRPLLATLAVVLVIGWSWSPRQNWATGFDLRTYEWTFSIEERIPLVRLMAASPLLLLGSVAIIVLAVRGRAAVKQLPWRFVPWLVPVAVVPLVAFNLGVLVTDSVKTQGWSLPRQNVSFLVGKGDCGLADDLRVAGPDSMRALRTAKPERRLPGNAPWASAPPVAGLATFSLLRSGDTQMETPWYRLPADERRVGFFVTSAIGAGDAVAVRWGSKSEAAVFAGEWQPVAVVPAAAAGADTVSWTFVSEGQLPGRTPKADVVQLLLRSDSAPPRALTTTGAVAYRSTPLRTLLDSPRTRSLVWPNVVLYMPCATLPKLQRGVVQVPTVVIAHNELWPIEFDSSPFKRTLDVYRLRDLSVGDSRLPPDGMQVLWIDKRIPGAALAAAEFRAET
jgi:cell wall arabinan synthesis protein/arabinosyltransferase-like concanavalin domain-containing protein